MSAICGIFNRQGEPVPAEVLEGMMSAMAHYGRDGGGSWRSGAATLGHQMTHVTPESLDEILPFEHAESQLAITCDARLDNRDELGSLLGISPEEQRVLPDSQFILKAYQRWGAECPRYLLGDFAFAIWDGRLGQVFCARDILGAKPFYYSINQVRFSFASDIGALLQSPGVSSELNLHYVRAYMEQPGFYHKEYTFYQDIHRLPPAQTLLVDAKRDLRFTYWTPEKSPEVRYRHEEEYIAHLRELLDEAVRPRLRSAFPLGAHLTGGLDSSTVAVLAARALPAEEQPLHVFSWAPLPAPEDYPLKDERALIEAISAKEGMIAHYACLRPEDVRDDINPDLTTSSTQISLDEHIASRQAANLGIRVLLSGWGGDEIPAFNGRGYFASLFLRLHWITLTRELYLRARLQEWYFWHGVRDSVVLPLIPDRLLAALRPHSHQLPQRMDLPASLQPGFAARLKEAEPLRKPHLRERPGVRRNQLDLLDDGHLAERTESWALIGAVTGIEYRYPLADRRIIEYCLGLPDWLYFKNGWKRYLFRRSVDGILPPEAQWKKIKSDPAWLNARGLSSSEIIDLMAGDIRNRREAILSAGNVDPDALVAELEDHKGPPPSDGTPPKNNSSPPIWLTYLKTVHN